ncbi:Leucine-rich repeat pentatricopeptide [Trema orientale]|uniref:Leucine-rich repeat pentatricopeptide n=1 Tax=Trema orientale TaxID=63057 RepID=A0A2P5A8M6_TREOI|nr:Leucine-rich repeat pentatricopeptide [Trema orientale]
MILNQISTIDIALGTAIVEGMYLNTCGLQKVVHLRPTVFQGMCNLRFLLVCTDWRLGDINGKVYLKGLEYFPPSLRYLEWQEYPLKCLPPNFEPHNLVVLNMPYSKLEKLSNGVQNLYNLKGIDLSCSFNLTQFPDLSGARNLERIKLRNCSSLTHISSHSLQNLDKLVDLDLSDCQNLRSLPNRIDARTLKTLNLGGCYNLITLPDIFPRNLVSLDLNGTAIKNLPSSIGSLNNLCKLDISTCRFLTNIPSTMCKLGSVKVLELSRCFSLGTFPKLPRNIEQFSLSSLTIKEVPLSSIEYCFGLKNIEISCSSLGSLPTGIFKLRSLAHLDLSHCSNLKNLPEILEPTESLNRLYLSGTGITELPSSIAYLIGLSELDLSNCKNLESIPDSISSMNNILRFGLSGCSKIENLPPSIGNLLSLEYLHLDGTSISEIPTSIKQLSYLIHLDVMDCRNLLSLPELPKSLQYLDASGCTSLKMVSNGTSSAFIQGFWDDCDITEETYECSVFFNCFELHRNGRYNIITEFQRRVLRMALGSVPPPLNQRWYPCVDTCYPGDEIPEWFTYQSMSKESSINIKLPQQWYNANFLGFAVCAVARKYGLGFNLRCNFDLKPGKSSSFTWDFGSYERKWSAVPNLHQYHVFMWYWHYDYHRCLHAVEAKFKFFCSKDFGSNDAIQIERCGMRMLYRQDIEELSLVNDQQYLLEQSADIVEQPEASARGTVKTRKRGKNHARSIEAAPVLGREKKETGLIPNAVDILDGLCKDGLVQEAMKPFALMREKGTVPDVFLCTAVVGGICMSQKHDDAIRIYRKMQNNGIDSNAFSYSVLIQGLYKLRGWRMVLSFVRKYWKMGTHQISLLLWDWLMGCVKKRVLKKLKVLLESKGRRGFR